MSDEERLRRIEQGRGGALPARRHPHRGRPPRCRARPRRADRCPHHRHARHEQPASGSRWCTLRGQSAPEERSGGASVRSSDTCRVCPGREMRIMASPCTFARHRQRQSARLTLRLSPDAPSARGASRDRAIARRWRMAGAKSPCVACPVAPRTPRAAVAPQTISSTPVRQRRLIASRHERQGGTSASAVAMDEPR
jgi:hypothetical protein